VSKQFIYFQGYKNIIPLETLKFLKNFAFWDVTPRDSLKNLRFGGIYASIIRAKRISELEKR
jgi:hypothetical protein